MSEGEKTAIAFVYFIVHLNDNDFNIQDSIVVIDDPISSLDSSSIYQAFSFLKNAVKDAKQVILPTHNFDFLKLLLNWLARAPHAAIRRHWRVRAGRGCDDGPRARNDASGRAIADRRVDLLGDR